METLEDIKKKYEDYSKEDLQTELYKKTILIDELNQFIHGKRSEKHGSSSVLYQDNGLFDEAEENQDSEQEEIDNSEDEGVGSTEPENSPPKNKRKKKKICFEALPHEVEVNDLPDSEKFDDNGAPLRQVGTDIKKIIEYTPPKLHVREIHTPKYAKDLETSEGISTEFVTAPKEPSVLPKSPASASLLAQIIVSKYMDALPLYRQQQIFQRIGVELSRNTLANWVIKSSELMRPLYNLMKDDILESPVVHCDETTTQTLVEPNKTAESKSYMWCVGRTVEFSAVLFHYSPYRNKGAAFELLDDYSGYVTCDGYSVYDAIMKSLDIKLTGCFAHIRRKFEQARKISKKNGKKDRENLAINVLKMIAALYQIEKEIKDLPPDKKLEVRKEKSQAIINDLKEWLDEKSIQILASSPLGKAISYAQREWPKIIMFLEDGRIAIDNNFIERRIRPFTIGRKNWCFSVSQAGADASALFYSFIETAKLNGICPYDYLRIVFKELAKENTLESFERLLPYNISKYFNVKKLPKPHE